MSKSMYLKRVRISSNKLITSNRILCIILFALSAVIGGCEFKEEPVIFGSLRAGDSQGQILAKIKSDTSISYMPVLGLYAYKVQGYGSLSAILLYDNDALIGAKLLSPAFSYKEQAKPQILTLVNHFKVAYGEPDVNLKAGEIENLITPVLSGKLNKQDVYTWTDSDRKVSLSLNSRKSGMYGITLLVVSK